MQAHGAEGREWATQGPTGTWLKAEPSHSRALVRATLLAVPLGSDPQVLAGVETYGTRVERMGSQGDSQFLPDAVQPGLGVPQLQRQVLHVLTGTAAGVSFQCQSHNQLQRAERGVSPACSYAWHSAHTTMF